MKLRTIVLLATLMSLLKVQAQEIKPQALSQFTIDGQLDDANKVFEFIWVVFDSLGETYLAEGDIFMGKNVLPITLEIHLGNINAIKALSE